MSTVVIDTNVLLVANRRHAGVSAPCIAACVVRLLRIRAAETVVLDDGRRIISEYARNFQPTQQPGVGDEFMKWLAQNQANVAKVHQVKLDETAANEFAQFPDAQLQIEFDPPDRKFVATSAAHADRPPIVQAADSKWVAWWARLEQHGISVQFPCPHDIKRFYAGKFPNAAAPVLPGEQP
jgi:hypothetical protein